MHTVDHFTTQNARAWDEIAQVRYRTLSPGAAFFAAGGITLDPRAVAALGDVRGKELLHLMCATGEDTLSWSVLGASASGIDISARQIELARRMAQDAGLETRFEVADVYHLPGELLSAKFDIVYTGGGVLVWLPDLQKWAETIFAALKAGGTFLLLEEHPLSNCLQVSDDELRVSDDYFRRGRPWEGAGWAHFRGGEAARENKFEFAWPLGDVVSALAAAGLRIRRLVEYPAKTAWRSAAFAQHTQGLPGQYLLIVVKE